MSGSKKCPCGLHYIAERDEWCWFCRNGYDPRGPFASRESHSHAGSEA